MIAVLALVAAVQAAPVRPFGLTTEWRENPVGIDAPRPRLGWKLPSGRQAAYELEIDGVAFGKTAGEAHVNVPWPASPPPASANMVRMAGVSGNRMVMQRRAVSSTISWKAGHGRCTGKRW